MKDKKKSKEVPKEEVDYKDLLVRTQANFENYRKQSEKRIEDIREMASRNVVLQLLPLLDNFELALKQSNANAQDLREGVELIHGQLKSLLESNHVKSVDEINRQFDPYLHEALIKVSSKEPEGFILETLQKGYTLNGKLVRPARVKISAGPDNTNEKNTNEHKSEEIKNDRQ